MHSYSEKLEAMETALENNAKFIMPVCSDLVNVVSEMAGIVPLKKKQEGSIIGKIVHRNYV